MDREIELNKIFMFDNQSSNHNIIMKCLLCGILYTLYWKLDFIAQHISGEETINNHIMGFVCSLWVFVFDIHLTYLGNNDKPYIRH